MHASEAIDFHFGYRCAASKIMKWLAPASRAVPVNAGRAIVAGGGQADPFQIGFLDDFSERDSYFLALAIEHFAAFENNVLLPEFWRLAQPLKREKGFSCRRLAQGLTEAMKEFSVEYETVTVVTADGTKLVGTLLNEDSFTLQMIDTREKIHSFEKDKLRSLEKSRESLMPIYDQKMLTDENLQDLIAYLLEATD